NRNLGVAGISLVLAPTISVRRAHLFVVVTTRLVGVTRVASTPEERPALTEHCVAGRRRDESHTLTSPNAHSGEPPSNASAESTLSRRKSAVHDLRSCATVPVKRTNCGTGQWPTRVSSAVAVMTAWHVMAVCRAFGVCLPRACAGASERPGSPLSHVDAGVSTTSQAEVLEHDRPRPAACARVNPPQWPDRAFAKQREWFSYVSPR
ncbi:hypothetical protein GA0061093_1671, partial [Rhodococcus qingshengii]